MDYGLIGIGFGLGFLINHLIATRPLQRDLQRMYYDGFKISHLPPKPKFVPDPTRKVRED